jgi:hypothetical protein
MLDAEPSRGCLFNAAQGLVSTPAQDLLDRPPCKDRLLARAVQQLKDVMGLARELCLSRQEFYARKFGCPPDVPTQAFDPNWAMSPICCPVGGSSCVRRQ